MAENFCIPSFFTIECYRFLEQEAFSLSFVSPEREHIYTLVRRRPKCLPPPGCSTAFLAQNTIFHLLLENCTTQKCMAIHRANVFNNKIFYIHKQSEFQKLVNVPTVLFWNITSSLGVFWQCSANSQPCTCNHWGGGGSHNVQEEYYGKTIHEQNEFFNKRYPYPPPPCLMNNVVNGCCSSNGQVSSRPGIGAVINI